MGDLFGALTPRPLQLTAQRLLALTPRIDLGGKRDFALLETLDFASEFVLTCPRSLEFLADGGFPPLDLFQSRGGFFQPPAGGLGFRDHFLVPAANHVDLFRQICVALPGGFEFRD